MRVLVAALVALAVLVWPPGERWRRSGVGLTRLPEGEARRSVGWSGTLVPALTRRRRDDGAWVADVAEVVAVGLEAGLDLPSAARAAARSPTVRRDAPWLAERLAEVAASGGSPSTCLDPPAPLTTGARRDLDLLVAAWRLTEEAGAPAAVMTAAAAEAVRERRASRDRAAVAVAGPRASMWLLTALPLLGPLGGLLVGFGPDRLYASSAARAAALAGVLLTAGGWWWARTVLGRAARPATTGRPDDRARDVWASRVERAVPVRSPVPTAAQVGSPVGSAAQVGSPARSAAHVGSPARSGVRVGSPIRRKTG